MNSRHVVVHGIKGIQKRLQSEKSRFAAAPILLVQGRTEDKDKVVDTCCKQVNFLLAQQLGFRTIVSDALGTSAFPTVDLVQQQVDLAARVGSATVCAVGSEAAVHLAKAVQDAAVMPQELILIPATNSAVMASTMERSLLMDTKEETLVPSHKPHSSSSNKTSNSTEGSPNVTIALPDASMLDVANNNRHVSGDISFAVLAFCCARQGQGQTYPDEIYTYLEQFASFAKAQKHKETLNPLLKSLLSVGQDMKFGLETKGRRDASLAIAVSLLPKIFPTSCTVSIMASHLPCLLQDDNSDNKDVKLVTMYQQLVDMFGEPNSLVCNQSVDTLLGIVRENQAAWNCLDARKDVMTQFLATHSLVD